MYQSLRRVTEKRNIEISLAICNKLVKVISPLKPFMHLINWHASYTPLNLVAWTNNFMASLLKLSSNFVLGFFLSNHQILDYLVPIPDHIIYIYMAHSFGPIGQDNGISSMTVQLVVHISYQTWGSSSTHTLLLASNFLFRVYLIVLLTTFTWPLAWGDS